MREPAPFSDGLWLGYRRPAGAPGSRNRLLIVPTVICSNRVCERIAEQTPEAAALLHPHGCSQIGDDAGLTFRTLAGLTANPNAGAVLIVGLGCEVVEAERLAAEAAATGKPVEVLTIQESGGSIRAIELGMERARQLAAGLRAQPAEPAGPEELVIGMYIDEAALEDPEACRLAGRLADMAVSAGAAVILGQTLQLAPFAEELGTRSREAAQDLAGMLKREARVRYVFTGDEAASPKAPERAGRPSPFGAAPLQGALAYGEAPRAKGLWWMSSPQNDVETLTGFAAAGAQAAVYVTGRAAPTGSPVLPVLKACTDQAAAERLADHVDVEAFSPAYADEVWAKLLAAAGGEMVKAEILGHEEFNIRRIGITL